MHTGVSLFFVAAIVVSEWDMILAGCFDVPIADICNNGTQDIPYLSSRDPSTTMTNETLQQKYCDLYAMEKHQWFKSETTMTTTCPEMYKCGTKFPIWMKGLHPEPDEGIVNRIACLRDFENCCLIRYSLTAVNCGQYYAYCLFDLPSGCPQRYCFDSQTGLSSTHAWTSANLNRSVPTYSTSTLSSESEPTMPVVDVFTVHVYDKELISILVGVFVLTVVAIFVFLKCRRHLIIKDDVARSTEKTPNKLQSQTLSGLGGKNMDVDTGVDLSNAEYSTLHIYETIPEIDKSSSKVNSENH